MIVVILFWMGVKVSEIDSEKEREGARERACFYLVLVSVRCERVVCMKLERKVSDLGTQLLASVALVEDMIRWPRRRNEKESQQQIGYPCEDSFGGTFLTLAVYVGLLDIHLLLSRPLALLLGVYRNIMIRCNPWRYVWQYITSINISRNPYC